MTELDSICELSQSSIFWKRHPEYREPLEVLADNEILKRVDFYEYIENTGKEKLIKPPDIYEHSHHYRLVKGYKTNYKNPLSVVNKLSADKLETALKMANIDYVRRDDYLSIEESWNQIESGSYMHIHILE